MAKPVNFQLFVLELLAMKVLLKRSKTISTTIDLFHICA